MAASSSPNQQYCANCGTSLPPGSLACPNCGRLSYAEQLQEIATRARQLVAMGQLAAARDQWRIALNLLPQTSREYQAIQREIAQLDARLNPQPKPDWRKRLGPFGVVVAFLAKFKGVLFALAKFKTFFSLFAFFGVYWAMFGWWFAVGMCGSIFIHEMGHYFMVRRYGFSAELPMFVPGFGAYVKWNGPGVDVGTRAMISLAGPLFGFASGILALALYQLTGHGVWMAVAHFAGWLNLLNLIPVSILDGGSAMYALGKQQRLALIIVSLVLLLLLHDLLFLIIAIATGYRMWRADYASDPRNRIGLFFTALVIANGFLSWYTALQGFAR